MKAIVGIALLFTFSSAAVIDWPSKPSFCKNYDCPKYSVVSSNDLYELRSYEQSYWVTVRTVTNGYWQNRISARRSFWKLFRYIRGNNAQTLTMAMTSPVLRYHQEDQVVMSFMIPYAFFGRAPTPTDSDVTLFTSPAMSVYVKEFSGEVWGADYNLSAELEEFRSELAADNVAITTDTFYAAVYDSPYVRRGDRHNEIWIAKP